MLIVMKFGGTSVGSAERIAQAAQLATSRLEQGDQVVVVTSAMSGVTNALIEAAQEAAQGRVSPAVRQVLLEKHGGGAAALSNPDGPRRGALLDVLNARLDRLEKLCFGLSMVHELTPRL